MKNDPADCLTSGVELARKGKDVSLPPTDILESVRALESKIILILEDEPSLRELMAHQLKRDGYAVLLASTSSEALDFWKEHAGEIKLLVTDMVIGDGTTGCDLAEKLLALNPCLKVIYTSGFEREVIEQDYTLGKDAIFLQKPYDHQELEKIIHTMLITPQNG
jgi:two-component system, cell cycle sensor histidine kinase and response regulator CckA